MTPFAPPFYIRGQAGKAIDTTQRWMADLDARFVVLTYNSWASDTLSFVLPRPLTGAWLRPDIGQQITLYDSANRRIFTGTAEVESDLNDGLPVCRVKCLGPYEWLKKTPIRTASTDATGVTVLRPQITFPKATTGASATTLLTLAVTNGAPFAVGNIPAGFEVSVMSFADVSYESVLIATQQWLSDTATAVEYDVLGAPKLHIVRRTDGRQVTWDLDADSNVSTVKLKPRGDMRPIQVRVQSVALQAGTGKPYYVTEAYPPGTVAGPAHLIQEALISGPEYGDTELQNETPSFDLQSIKAERGDVLLSWIMEADTFLAGLISQFGAQWWRSNGSGTMAIASAEILRWYNGSAADAVTQSRTLVTTTITDTSGNRLSASGWFILRSTDPIPSWYTAVTKMSGIIKFDIVMEVLGSAGTGVTPRRPGETEFAARCFNAWDVNYYGGRTRPATYHVYSVNMPVTLINQYIPSLTTYYQSTGYLYNNPPGGLAQSLFQAQQWDPYTGDASLVPGIADIPLPGETVSVTNADDFPSWATVMAQVSTTQITLGNEAAEVEVMFDPPARVDASSLLERIRRGARDNIVKSS